MIWAPKHKYVTWSNVIIIPVTRHVCCQLQVRYNFFSFAKFHEVVFVGSAYACNDVNYSNFLSGSSLHWQRWLMSLYSRELLVMGGDSAKNQMRALQDGVDIVCGTPGRLDDLISTGRLDLSGVSSCEQSCCCMLLTVFHLLFRSSSLCLMKRWVVILHPLPPFPFNNLF